MYYAICTSRHVCRLHYMKMILLIYLTHDDVFQWKHILRYWPSLVWADVILTDFQRVISRYLQDIGTYLSRTVHRVLRTMIMQKSKPKYACLPTKTTEVWIGRFCVRCDWWRRLQPTSSVSPVCLITVTDPIKESPLKQWWNATLRVGKFHCEREH